MSHLNERKQKNCLNCNAQVHGKYCHICGQENLEPVETAWYLITHFFNDITHFDGKFFSTLYLLLTKPGFLSSEYKTGRRVAYLNPVRMYIFTSFIFFFIFFSAFHLDEDLFKSTSKPNLLTAISRLDSAAFKKSTDAIDNMDSMQLRSFSMAVNNGNNMTRQYFNRYADSARKLPEEYNVLSPIAAIVNMDSTELSNFNMVVGLMDSVTFKKTMLAINAEDSITKQSFFNYIDSSRLTQRVIMGGDIKFNKKNYDSLVKAGAIKDGWIMKRIRQKVFDINEKFRNTGDKVFAGLLKTLVHNFPQMLFVSLPLFAFFLKLIYYRRKHFYLVSHGIYSIHLYIFYFIMLLVMLSLDRLGDYVHWAWLSTLAGMLIFLLLLYEYKAMHNFYGQRRFKTFIKFLLALAGRLIIILLLFVLFFFFSILKL